MMKKISSGSFILTVLCFTWNISATNVGITYEDYNSVIEVIYRTYPQKIDLKINDVIVEECLNPKVYGVITVDASTSGFSTTKSTMQIFIAMLQCILLIEKDAATLQSYEYFSSSVRLWEDDLVNFIYENDGSLIFAHDFITNHQFVSPDTNLNIENFLNIKREFLFNVDMNIEKGYVLNKFQDFQADFVNSFVQQTISDKLSSLDVIISKFSPAIADISDYYSIPTGIYIDDYLSTRPGSENIYYLDGSLKSLANVMNLLILRLNILNVIVIKYQSGYSTRDILSEFNGNYSIKEYLSTDSGTFGQAFNDVVQILLGDSLVATFSTMEGLSNYDSQNNAVILATIYDISVLVQPYTENGAPIFSFCLYNTDSAMLSVSKESYQIYKLFDALTSFDVKTKKFQSVTDKSVKYPINLNGFQNEIKKVGIWNYRNFKRLNAGFWSEDLQDLDIEFSTITLKRSIIKVLYLDIKPWYNEKDGEAWGFSKYAIDFFLYTTSNYGIDIVPVIMKPPTNVSYEDFIIDQMKNGVASISAYPIEIGRDEVVSSYPIIENYRVIIQSRDIDGWYSYYLLIPYRLGLWILNIIAVVIFVLVFVVHSLILDEKDTLDELNESTAVEFDREFREKSKKYLKFFRFLDKYLHHVVNVMLLNRFKGHPRAFSSKILHISLHFFTIGLVLSYAAVFSSFLNYEEDSAKVDSIADLQRSNLKWFYEKNSYGYQKSVGKEDLKIAQQRFPDTYLVDDIDAAIKRLNSDPNSFFITDRLTALYYKNQNCNFIIIEDTSEIYIQAFPVNKPENFVASQRVIDIFKILSELNLFLHLFQLFFELGTCGNLNSIYSQPKTLTYVKLGPLFMFLLLGIIMSIIFSGLSYLWKKLYTEYREKKLVPFRLGQTYMCEVVNVTDRGIYIHAGKGYPPFFVQSSQLHDDPIKDKTPSELGIVEGKQIPMKYLGKDDIHKERKWIHNPNYEENAEGES